MNAATDPQEAINAFAAGMRRAYDKLCGIQLSTRGLPPGSYRILRMQGEDATEPFTAPTPTLLPVHDAGLFAQLLANAAPAALQHVDLSSDPIVGQTLGHCRSLVLAPVIEQSLPVDWVALLHPDPTRLGMLDLEELILRANLVGVFARSLQVGRQLEAANLRIAREIEQIARIQRTLLPSQLPEIPGLAIAAHYETFDRAGGDLYDFARLEGDPTTDADDRWAILIADASGHGPAAATVCAIVHSILHAYPQEPDRPAELLRHVNRHLCAKQIEASFVTAFLAFYHPSTRQLVCARAGHNPPVLLSAPRDNGRRELLGILNQAKGLPLGIDPDAPFDEESVILEPGQLAILYTDGVVEARNLADEEFGIEGIINTLAHCPDGAEIALRQLTQAVNNHLGHNQAGDDRTILVLEGV